MREGLPQEQMPGRQGRADGVARGSTCHTFHSGRLALVPEGHTASAVSTLLLSFRRAQSPHQWSGPEWCWSCPFQPLRRGWGSQPRGVWAVVPALGALNRGQPISLGPGPPAALDREWRASQLAHVPAMRRPPPAA